MAVMIFLAKIAAIIVVSVMVAYTVRHFIFAMARLFKRQRQNFTDVSGFHLPSITVLIPMHNEEKVAPDVIEALLEADYPHDPELFEIIPINDHSTDRTGEILDEYAKKYPFIKPLHRTEGLRGKPAGLRAATQLARGEILILFDADYIPGKSLLKFLSAPFVDPEVGAVMGRVVPHNVGSSLLTRLLDLERSGGYQINQQARYNLGLIPQFGGTVGSVRRSALESVGGWNSFTLTEDTDLTLQMVIKGWKIAYVNRAECYEEVVESWSARRGQIDRWAIGHTDCFHRYLGQMLRSPLLDWKTKLDGTLMLGVYITAPLLILGWLACTILFFAGQSFLPLIAFAFLASTAYNALGNFASFFEMGSSVILDGSRSRVRLLPLNIANFVFSTAAVSTALGRYYTNRMRGRDPGERWVKTERFRGGPGGSGSASNGSGLNRGDGNTNGVGSKGNGSDTRQGPRMSLFAALGYKFARKEEAVAVTAPREANKTVGLNLMSVAANPKTTSGASKSGRRGLNFVRAISGEANILPVAGENGRTISQVIRLRRQISDPELGLGYSAYSAYSSGNLPTAKQSEDSVDLELKSLLVEVEEQVSVKNKKK
jgi:cellulose synthase/poly-beta-1,6-N-acetylglucosamine synthase-like glycosyltransferase